MTTPVEGGGKSPEFVNSESGAVRKGEEKEIKNLTDELLLSESVQTYGTPLTTEEKKKLEKALHGEVYLPPEEGEPASGDELKSESTGNPLFQNIPYNRIVANAHLQQRALNVASMIEMEIQADSLLAELQSAKEIAHHILQGAKDEQKGYRRQALLKMVAAGGHVLIGARAKTAAGAQAATQTLSATEGAISNVQQGETVVEKAVHDQMQQILQSAQKNLQSMMDNASQDRREKVARVKDVFDMLNRVIDEYSRLQHSLTAQHG